MLSFHSVRTVGFEPTISSSPNWRDNQTSLRSDVSSPPTNLRSVPDRTHLSALKERYPAPIDERAMLCRLCARTFHAVDREALESSSPALQAGARPSQLPVRLFVWMCARKKPDVAVTPGFAWFARVRPSVTSATDAWDSLVQKRSRLAIRDPAWYSAVLKTLFQFFQR